MWGVLKREKYKVPDIFFAGWIFNGKDFFNADPLNHKKYDVI